MTPLVWSILLASIVVGSVILDSFSRSPTERKFLAGLRWAAVVGMIITIVWMLSKATYAQEEYRSFPATVVSVYDGDTPKVDIDLGFDLVMKDINLRLLCVDTPEMVGSERVEGTLVRDFVRDLMPPGTRVHLEITGTGKFGRPLAILTIVGEPITLNQLLYSKGMAEIEAYSAAQIRYCEELLALPDAANKPDQ